MSRADQIQAAQVGNQKTIIVFGKSGQVALALKDLIGKNAEFFDRESADFSKPSKVIDLLKNRMPDVIINASAYTAVDKAESEPEACDLVNHQTPAAIARWVAQNNKVLIHYSSDYVFDGSGVEPRDEDAATGPLSVYGRTKLAGDLAIVGSGAKALILRTSWVYSHVGYNFFKTMLRLGSDREELSIVADQVGSPTYAPALAEITLQMLNSQPFEKQQGCEIYNVCGRGFCSWYDFANEIFRRARELGYPLKIDNLKRITTSEYPTPAQRPLNSRLSQKKLKRDFGLEMPYWQASLDAAFLELGRNSRQ